MWWKTMPDPFLKNQDWIYLWINSLKFYVFCFYCMLSWRLSKLLEPSCIVLAFISHKAFLKTKVWNWGLELVSAIWKSRHRHLGISIGIDVGIGIAKNLLSLCKVFIFTFRSFRKHPWWSTFQVHLLTFLRVSGNV